MKNKTNLPAISALLLFAAIALPAWNAVGQDTRSVAGTYTPVVATSFGDNPRGQLILGSDGHYSINLARATLPKIAAGARTKGTDAENKAIVGGSIFHYGRYVIDVKEKTITFNVEASTFPNWDGATFKRAFKFSGDQLTYTDSAPSDGGAAHDVVWKRIK